MPEDPIEVLKKFKSMIDTIRKFPVDQNENEPTIYGRWFSHQQSEN